MLNKSLFVGVIVFVLFLIGCGGGSSVSGAGGTQGLVPAITSISPSIANAGSAALTLSVSGSNFASRSEIEWNGSPLLTNYVSASQLTGQVPATDLEASGTAQVTVYTPDTSSGRSNAMAFTVVYPPLQLTSISPTSAAAGSTALTISATGSGFTSNSLLEWNGMALATNYLSSEQLTAQVPASDLRMSGSAQVTVVNATPSGQSRNLLFSIVPGTTTITTIPMAANDIVWDGTHGKLYASLPASTRGGGNSVVAIDPVAGGVVAQQAAGLGPNLLSLSSDDSYLWVGEDGSGVVQRFTLPSLSPDVQIPIPTTVSSGTQTALSLESAPNSPETVAILIGSYLALATDLSIYDGPTQRPSTLGFAIEDVASLLWGSDATTLYGVDGEYGSYGFAVMSVNSSGVTLQRQYPAVFDYELATPLRIHYDQPTGYVYGDDGRVLNPATGDLVGTFNLSPLGSQNGFKTFCIVDNSQGIVFFLGQSLMQWLQNAGYTILAFDKSSYRMLGSLSLSQYSGQPSRFVRWGNAGLAFTTTPFNLGAGAIYLLDGSFVNSSAAADISSGATVQPLPLLNSISPQGTSAGSGNVTLTVTGGNFGQGAVIYWNGSALKTAYVNPSQLQATIPASELTAAGSGIITVSNGSLSTLALNEQAFTIRPSSTGLTALNLAALDVVWDRNSSLLYAAVWSADTQYPNSIVAINPVNGEVVKSQYVGCDPYLVRTSADGAYLYTGFEVSNFAAQMQIPAMSPPLSWSLGANSLYGPLIALDLQPAPGASQTSAIATGIIGHVNNTFNTFDFTASGELTIFDNNVPRPGVAPEGSYPADYVFGSLQWGSDGSNLYAADNEDTAASLYQLAVNSSGASVSQVAPDAVDNGSLANNPDTTGFNFFTSIHFDAGTGYLYDDDGVVINPATATQVGVFDSNGLVAPDSSMNRVFILGQTRAQLGTGDLTIASFNQTTFQQVNSIALTGIVGAPKALVRWGTNGLAFVTYNDPLDSGGAPPGMLYILNNPRFVSASESADSRLESVSGWKTPMSISSSSLLVKPRRGQPARTKQSSQRPQ